MRLDFTIYLCSCFVAVLLGALLGISAYAVLGPWMHRMIIRDLVQRIRRMVVRL